MRHFEGLLKLARASSPVVPTVGDFMHAWNANLNANPVIRHDAFGRINDAGLDVKQPASRILHVLGGGLAGRAAASYLGASPFWKGVATIGGAIYGNRLYNRNNPDPGMRKVAPGLVMRGF